MMYDELYKMNIGCDFVHPASENLEDYTLLVVPALYTASDSLLERLNEFVKKTAVILCIPSKSGFTDEKCQSENNASARYDQRSLRHYVQYVC
ncbi:hypothetical protein GCM10020331_086970 [Ectobacillus funiculus]